MAEAKEVLSELGASSAGGPQPGPSSEGGVALSGPVGEGGGALSPLSGAYLLVVLSEPMSEAHKTKMVQKLRQGRSQCLY